MSKQTLRPAQRIALVTLVETGNITSAAEAAGVTRETAHRWLREPLFIDALRGAEAEALQSLSRQMIRLSTKATDVVEGVLDDPKISPTVRLRAADVVLSRLLQLRELIDLEGRVAELEAKVQA